MGDIFVSKGKLTCIWTVKLSKWINSLYKIHYKQYAHLCARTHILSQPWFSILAIVPFSDAHSVVLQQGVNQVHEVAACLKLFLRSLKDPLLMSTKHQLWIDNAGRSPHPIHLAKKFIEWCVIKASFLWLDGLLRAMQLEILLYQVCTWIMNRPYVYDYFCYSLFYVFFCDHFQIVKYTNNTLIL